MTTAHCYVARRARFQREAVVTFVPEVPRAVALLQRLPKLRSYELKALLFVKRLVVWHGI